MKYSEIKIEKKALVVVLIALLYIFWNMMDPFLMPVSLAAILAGLTFPFYSRVQKIIGTRNWVAALISTLTILFVFILPSALFIKMLINQTYDIVGNLNLKETYANFFSHDFYVKYLEPMVLDFEQTFETKIDILGLLTQLGKEAAKTIYNFSPSVLLGTANFIFDFSLMMVSLYFLFLEGPTLIKVVMDISPLRDTHEKRILRQFKNTIDASIYGYLLTAFVQAAIAAILFMITGLQGFLVLGTLTFFFGFVPIVGVSGVWIPVCVWLFLQGEIGWALFNLGGGIFISIIDNFLKPIIIQGRTSIHPLLIFFSLFGGIKFFGILGILFGPVITASLIAVINIYREEFMHVS